MSKDKNNWYTFYIDVELKFLLPFPNHIFFLFKFHTFIYYLPLRLDLYSSNHLQNLAAASTKSCDTETETLELTTGNDDISHSHLTCQNLHPLTLTFDKVTSTSLQLPHLLSNITLT